VRTGSSRFGPGPWRPSDGNGGSCRGCSVTFAMALFLVLLQDGSRSHFFCPPFVAAGPLSALLDVFVLALLLLTDPAKMLASWHSDLRYACLIERLSHNLTLSLPRARAIYSDATKGPFHRPYAMEPARRKLPPWGPPQGGKNGTTSARAPVTQISGRFGSRSV
jgi:hypothetical protein